MAVLARRTWAQQLSEVTLRVGNIASSGFDSRLQYWLAASYDHLCTTYHHTELDTFIANTACATTSNSVALPSDVLVLVGVRLHVASPGLYDIETLPTLGPLVVTDYRSVADSYTQTAGVPAKCARYGSRLYFDMLPAEQYVLAISYYRYGTAPDFGATSPELGRDVDEHIIEGALRYAFPSVARPDLGAVQRQLLADWLIEQVRASTLYPLVNLPERERSATTTTGTQG